MRKIAYKFRQVAFAVVMSFTTAFIISGAITYLHAAPGGFTMKNWFSGFIAAWPLVFISIMVIAPLVDKLINLFVEDH